MTNQNRSEHLCKQCVHALRMPRSIGGIVFDAVECFELNKDITQYYDRYDITECDSFSNKKK